MSASSVDPLVVGRVIGDVIDLFVPSIDMSINYGTKTINKGCNIRPSTAADPPTVNIAGKTSDLYTLVPHDI
jgi:phosphatidylethanolamine-binding protein